MSNTMQERQKQTDPCRARHAAAYCTSCQLSPAGMGVQTTGLI